MRVQSSGCKVKDSYFGFQGFRFRVQDLRI
jgi:hypothetical protein